MTITTLLWVLLVPAMIIIGVVLWLSESRQQRIHRLRSNGWSQARIADHLNITRYAVKKALTT